MDVVTAFVAFGSALLGALAGSWVTVRLGAQVERRAEVRKLIRSIYGRLMELYSYYFWMTTAEMHAQQPRADVVGRIERLAWGILDDLREVDEHPVLPSVVEVLASEDFQKYPDAMTRYLELGKVLKHLGSELNPRYLSAIGQVGDAKFQALASRAFGPSSDRNNTSNAPAALGM
jgi:hypothetical protein